MVFRLFSFSTCNPAKTEVSYDTTEGGIGLEKDSALYQLMDTRMHSVMNGIVSSDGEYQAILRKSDVYSGELERMDLSKEIRLLIDRYVSEQNALGSRFGMLYSGPSQLVTWPLAQSSKQYHIFNEVCTSHSSLTVLPQWGHLIRTTVLPSAMAIKSQILFRHSGHLILHISQSLPQPLLDF